MSEAVAAAKNKKIAKAKVGRQVRLWVRAKFLSFRRYSFVESDPRLIRTATNRSWNSKASTIVKLPNTISANVLSMSTKLTPAKLTTDSEYSSCYSDHLGQNLNQPRQQRSSAGSLHQEPPPQSSWIHPQSHALPSEGLISYLFKSITITIHSTPSTLYSAHLKLAWQHIYFGSFY